MKPNPSKVFQKLPPPGQKIFKVGKEFFFFWVRNKFQKNKLKKKLWVSICLAKIGKKKQSHGCFPKKKPKPKKSLLTFGSLCLAAPKKKIPQLKMGNFPKVFPPESLFKKNFQKLSGGHSLFLRQKNCVKIIWKGKNAKESQGKNKTKRNIIIGGGENLGGLIK